MKTLLILPGMNSLSFNLVNPKTLSLPIRTAFLLLASSIITSSAWDTFRRYLPMQLFRFSSNLSGFDVPTDSEIGLTNRRGGHSGGGVPSNLGNTVKAFIVGIILYFVAVAIVYTIGSSNIINNATINSQIKNVAYFMSVLGTIIGLIAGTVFILKLLGGF